MELAEVEGAEVTRLVRMITGEEEVVVELLAVVSARDVVVDSSGRVDEEVEEVKTELVTLDVMLVLALEVETIVVQGLVAGIRGPPLWNQSPQTPP